VELDFQIVAHAETSENSRERFEAELIVRQFETACDDNLFFTHAD
jgi:hypothetical protein